MHSVEYEDTVTWHRTTVMPCIKYHGYKQLICECNCILYALCNASNEAVTSFLPFLDSKTTTNKHPVWETLKLGNLFQFSYEPLGEIHTVVLWVMNLVVLNVDTNISTIIDTVYVNDTLLHAYRNTSVMAQNNMKFYVPKRKGHMLSHRTALIMVMWSHFRRHSLHILQIVQRYVQMEHCTEK
jgi:hypothetical protein